MAKSTTHSAAQTEKLATTLAKAILRASMPSRAVVVALQGELGSGKTTFVKGFAKGLGVRSRITSPTFVILNKYKIPNTKYLHHIDCYRLRKPADLLSIGWKHILKDPRNIVLLEWPERIRRLLPKDAIVLRFSHAKGINARRIVLEERKKRI